MDSLDGNVEESGSRRAGREGVDLDVGTPHELGRVGGDAVIPELHLILGDQVGGDDAKRTSDSLLSFNLRVCLLAVGDLSKLVRLAVDHEAVAAIGAEYTTG